MYIKILTVITLFLQLSATAQAPASATNPFTSTTNTIPDTAQPAFTELKAAVEKQKILLNWTVAENQAINLFEIEKSTDGRHFTVAALVFGTDKPAENQYLFFEKNTGEKVTYRVRIISKNNKVIYSAPVTAG